MSRLITMSALLFFSVEALKPTNSAVVKTQKLFKYAGDTEPMRYFDPLQISLNEKTTGETIKYLREAELQHGRVAMMSFPVLVCAEKLTEQMGIHMLSSLSLTEQAPYWLGVAAFEATRLRRGWLLSPPFRLKAEYQPGNVFDVDAESIETSSYDKELNNGRLAMVGTLGFIAQELVTQQTIIC